MGAARHRAATTKATPVNLPLAVLFLMRAIIYSKTFAVALLVLAAGLSAQESFAQQQSEQQPAPQPLTAMPYSPSLDLNSLDRSVNPCEDFYKFSCGGWQKNNPIPADQASWSVYAKLGLANQQFLWGILAEDAKMTNRTPVQQKVGDYFAACMDTSAIDALGDKPIRPELAAIDAIKTRPEFLAALLRLHAPNSPAATSSAPAPARTPSTPPPSSSSSGLAASACPTVTTTSSPTPRASSSASNTPPTSSSCSHSPAKAQKKLKQARQPR